MTDTQCLALLICVFAAVCVMHDIVRKTYYSRRGHKEFLHQHRNPEPADERPDI